MSFDPAQHHRRSIRLNTYDYAQPGAYFITLCAQNRACVFGQITEGAIHTSSIGQSAQTQWQALPDRFPNIQLDTFVIMPNHIHGILHITDVEAPLAGAQPPTQHRATARVAPTCRGRGIQIVGVQTRARCRQTKPANPRAFMAT